MIVVENQQDAVKGKINMRIVADTATLLSPQDGEAMGITVVQAVKK
ncbi:MAG: hypothetical protein IIV99_05645 [Oscillospiraceae bacterium]|nr:hypothetical protein [Oscillospiraceae bacterium]